MSTLKTRLLLAGPVLPKDQIFRTATVTTQLGISIDDLMSSRLVPEINKQTFAKVQDDKESIQLISLNGIVFASKLGKWGDILDSARTKGADSRFGYLRLDHLWGRAALPTSGTALSSN